ncbi:MAG: enoyl-CoA hydratase-related protein, partial [Dehalococcoidia bacterium]|nr:enoyl-CoA hydratase-related protein [Dehalococcoidia bacterium]
MALLYEKKGKIAYFTLNRPEAFNSLDPDTLKEFHDALLDFRDDSELWVGIVTGAGNRAFCAGADLTKTIPLMMDPNKTPPWRTPSNIMRGLQLFKPLIAAINGMAL